MYAFIEKPSEYTLGVWKSLMKHNCYMYSLNYTGDEPVDCPGEISGFDFSDFETTGYIPTSELRKRIFSDCQKIGLKIREATLNDETTEDEWKIALFEKWIPEEYDYDYHFLREDAPNSWSGKFKYEMPSNLDDNYKVITNPEKAKFWSYKFVACFIIKKV